MVISVDAKHRAEKIHTGVDNGNSNWIAKKYLEIDADSQ